MDLVVGLNALARGADNRWDPSNAHGFVEYNKQRAVRISGYEFGAGLLIQAPRSYAL